MARFLYGIVVFETDFVQNKRGLAKVNERVEGGRREREKREIGPGQWGTDLVFH